MTTQAARSPAARCIYCRGPHSTNAHEDLEEALEVADACMRAGLVDEAHSWIQVARKLARQRR